MSSDKGLCGAIHASIGRAIRAAIPEKPPGTEVKIVCIGDKQRAALARFVTFDHRITRPPFICDHNLKDQYSLLHENELVF